MKLEPPRSGSLLEPIHCLLEPEHPASTQGSYLFRDTGTLPVHSQRLQQAHQDIQVIVERATVNLLLERCVEECRLQVQLAGAELE